MKKILIFILILLSFFALAYIIPFPQNIYRSPESFNTNGTFKTIDGIKIHFEDYGNKDSEAIVFIHGFGGSTKNWKKTIPSLSERRVVAIDLPGFGLSEKKLDFNYSHSNQVKIINLILEELGIHKVILVGHSMGGNVVTYFSMVYPEKVEKLILVDPAIVEEQSNIPFNNLLSFHPFVQVGRQILQRVVTRENFKNLLLSAYYQKELVDDNLVNEYFRAIEIKDWDSALLGITRDGNNKLPKNISTINFKTLIIWGEFDTWILPEKGRDLDNRIPNSELIIIKNSGHLPMEEAPDEFNSILNNFVKAS